MVFKYMFWRYLVCFYKLELFLVVRINFLYETCDDCESTSVTNTIFSYEKTLTALSDL